MILANYAQVNRNCHRLLGSQFTNPLAVLRPQVMMNFYTPDTALTGLDKSGFPHGYNTESSWQLPLKSGGMGATRGIRGSGTLTASALAVKLAVADLVGSGEISSALGSLIVSALANLTGSGGITNANLQAFLQAVASLTGSGGVSAATLTGLGALIAALTGSGTVTSTLTGIGELDADLTVTGTGLSTANVGDAVWSFVFNELSSIPGASPQAKEALQLLYQALRNQRATTASADTIRKDDGTVIGTSTLSDNGTTFDKGKYS